MTQVRVVFYRGGPSRTNLHLLALRSFHPNQEICSRVKCLPACLPVCRSAPRLSRETEQARKKGGGPRKFLVRLSLSDISAFLLPPPPRHFVNSTFQQFRIHPNSLPPSEKSPQSAKTLSFLIQINPFDSSLPTQSESYS